MLGFEVMFLFLLALLWIIFACVQDLKTTEISTWLNFSLAIIALAFRFLYSLFELGDFSFFYQGFWGLLIFFALGNILYYSKMFAGGDARLMYALGAILPISNDFFLNVQNYIFFLFLFLLVGAIYGILVVIYFGIRNFSKLKIEYKKQFKQRKRMTILATAFSILFLFLSFYNIYFVYFAGFLFFLPYFYLYVKSVDEACMVKKVKPSKLMLGDWLYRDVEVGNKKIKANWDGLGEDDIKMLEKKKFVWIRTGVQFAPVFLVSFVFYALNYVLGLNLLNYFKLV